MAVEGTLDLFRLPEILQVISQERKTGILTVQGADDIIAVSFLQGRIVAADALNADHRGGRSARCWRRRGGYRTRCCSGSRRAPRRRASRLADLLVTRGPPRP